MMTELMLVEGVSDVQLISYYLQNVYGWKHEKNNHLGIHSLDEHDHIESLQRRKTTCFSAVWEEMEDLHIS